MDGDRMKELFDNLGAGLWEEQPKNFESTIMMYKEASRKIRY